MIVDGFDWDAGNEAKCGKHGVSIADIEHVLSHGPRVAPDQAHSGTEVRFIGVGRTRDGRPLFVAFTVRRRDGAVLIRPISARYMHHREIERYEKENPEL